MKKEFKEQIKRDEFATGLKNAAEWARTHQHEVRIAIGVAVVVGTAAGGLAYVQGSRQREAERAFMEAVAIYEAPVASELAPGADKPTGPVFPSAEEKYKTAAAAFDGVERRHATLPVAVRAGYYALMSLAATLEDAKRLAEAVAAYKRLTEEFPASVYAGEARRKADYLQTAAQG